MKLIWKILVTSFGLLMVVFTLGYGPALFPGYVRGPQHVFSEAGQRVQKTRAKVVTSDVRPAAEPTWRNYVSAFFMLEPTDMVAVPSPKRSELEALRARSDRAPRRGGMSVMREGR